MNIATIEQEIANAEAQVPNLRPGCEKHIVWADKPATKTAQVLLNIHGFSASPKELHPLPEMIAQDIGANAVYARLTGHGQDGDALAKATFVEWMNDVAEAVKVAELLGDEIILMGCSTGCTMAALALASGAQAKACIMVSPNFGLRNWFAQTILDMPGVRYWGRYVAGKTRNFDPINEGHSAYWTTRYPTEALYPMADAVRAACQADYSRVTTPTLLVMNEADTVVHPKRTRKVMAGWGGPVTEEIVIAGPNDDASGHVMAGEVFSPDQTEPLARRISAWLQTL
ncbi:alpha/beta hydrolase [Loktanella sp. S4079]|uniref:alpha/beta hydrolase n=1 Tax=Loktanella sp. S4079 TaxID=579483 RepID=UPI0005FA2A3F|nr:alpha/beta fold hydrolase [Loktanella sp. S4079]KJZ20575.1 hypothetical protein TW80_07295 [Loktanella sp. S4079]